MMSDDDTCFVCGQPVDNSDATGYCTRCSADVGVYTQRSAPSADGAQDLSLSIDHLRSDVAAMLRRLEQVEAKLALAEERPVLPDDRSEGR